MTSFFYALARMFAWMSAIRRGPSAVGKRLARKEGYKAVNKLLR